MTLASRDPGFQGTGYKLALAKHFPAAKHYGPKGSTESKIRFPGPERFF